MSSVVNSNDQDDSFVIDPILKSSGGATATLTRAAVHIGVASQ
jgi:hypothetical protein